MPVLLLAFQNLLDNAIERGNRLARLAGGHRQRSKVAARDVPTEIGEAPHVSRNGVREHEIVTVFGRCARQDAPESQLVSFREVPGEQGRGEDQRKRDFHG